MMDMKEINTLILYGWVVLVKRKVGVYSWTFFSFDVVLWLFIAMKNRYGRPFFFLTSISDTFGHVGPYATRQ